MKVTYKGLPHDLPAKVQEKLDTKFRKLAKLLDSAAGEKSAHVVITNERRLNKAEVTLQIHDHTLVGLGGDSDLFTSVSAALLKLEKQALKHNARGRELRRRPARGQHQAERTNHVPVPGVITANPKPRIFRVRTHERRKPITLEEALLLMEDGRQYVAFRAMAQDRITILIRRPDGHVDMIEA
jgi:putative sigma-54 modulation protein